MDLIKFARNDKGKNCVKFETQFGNEETGKNIPESIIIGNTIRFATGANVSSLLDFPEIANPSPIKTAPPINEIIVIFTQKIKLEMLISAPKKTLPNNKSKYVCNKMTIPLVAICAAKK